MSFLQETAAAPAGELLCAEGYKKLGGNFKIAHMFEYVKRFFTSFL